MRSCESNKHPNNISQNGGEDKTISRWVGELFAYRKCQTALNSVLEYNGGIVGLRAAHGRMLMFRTAES